MTYPLRARHVGGIAAHPNRFAVLQDVERDERPERPQAAAKKRLSAERDGIAFSNASAPNSTRLMNEVYGLRLHSGNISGQFPDFVFARDEELGRQGYKTPYQTIQALIADLSKAGLGEPVSTYSLRDSSGIAEWANNYRFQHYDSSNVFLFGPARQLNAEVDELMDTKVLPQFMVRFSDQEHASAQVWPWLIAVGGIAAAVAALYCVASNGCRRWFADPAAPAVNDGGALELDAVRSAPVLAGRIDGEQIEGVRGREPLSIASVMSEGPELDEVEGVAREGVAAQHGRVDLPGALVDDDEQPGSNVQRGPDRSVLPFHIRER